MRYGGAIAGLVLLGVVAVAAIAGGVASERTLRKTIEVDGRTRTYYLHVPTSLPGGQAVPLVFVFHGGGGEGKGAERLTHFSRVADSEGFVAVYPDGLWKNWNDGREQTVSQAHRENIDDVAFIASTIRAVSREHNIDPHSIFATGISNGGIFSHYLAARLSPLIAAIAPVAGGIPERFQDKFKPVKPVSVLIVQGTEDPLTPFHGGDIARGKRGRIIDTEMAAQTWVKHNGCTREAVTGTLPDRDPGDGCRVKWYSWPEGRDRTEVRLYVIEGGGHTWPGGSQYLPRLLVGRVCRDFDATELIWQFFKRHSRS